MRCKSEETMEQIKNAVEEFYFAHYRSPSIGEIAAEVGRSKSTVAQHTRYFPSAAGKTGKPHERCRRSGAPAATAMTGRGIKGTCVQS